MKLLNEPLMNKSHVSEDSLDFKLQQILKILLGIDPENSTTTDNDTTNNNEIQHFLKQDRVFNSFFDLAERIYEYSDHQNIQKIISDQSPLIQILQKSRIALFKDKVAPFTYPLFEFIAHSNYSFVLLNSVPTTPLPSDTQKSASQAPLNQDSLSHKLDIHEIIRQQPLAKNNIALTQEKNQSAEFDQRMYYLIEPSHKPPTVLTMHNNNYILALKNGNQQNLIAPLPITASAINLEPEPKFSIMPKVNKMPYFQIPNARVGLPYEEQIKIQNIDNQTVQLKPESVLLPDELGISYDSERNIFYGTPAVSGEYPIKFQYLENGNWLEGNCVFIITADPRSLWQVNEPDADFYILSHIVPISL